jgi:hypothetical protein
MVPIRDHNHNVYPGIEAGEIGPKIGSIAKIMDIYFLKTIKYQE